MQLQSVTYSEWEGEAQEWKLDGLSLGARNLIVGKNASGKSRTLNVINGIARLLAGLQPPSRSGNYDIVLAHDDKVLRYQLDYQQNQVRKEKFTVANKVLLDRGLDGAGVIWAEEINNGAEIRFQTPPGELAAFAKRDNIQHPFLEDLYLWGASLRHFQFGTQLGKDHFTVLMDNGNEMPDDRDPNAVVALYQQGDHEFPEKFKQAVMSDMDRIGYDIEDIGLGVPISIQLLFGNVVGLHVKERGLKGITDQTSMSQGMFRALSILVQVNYSQMTKKAACLLIDDIGEGLDFDRSCRLIDILREKAQESNIQLILSTNDRFVMNRVPLEEWCVLQREGSHVKVRNYANSRSIFEEFEFTGLSNFSFLEMDFINGPSAEEVAIA